MSAAPSLRTAPALEDWTPQTLSSSRPHLGAAALYGLAGECVAAATMHSEASPAAVLATLLARFGCEAFNPDTQAPCLQIGETRHCTRLFVAVCGQTAKARKGTSAKPVERLFAFPQHAGLARRPQESPGPLSSGEGLIFAVRDKRQIQKADGELAEDAGATDKRLFVLDEELAAALKVTRREGNILSTVLRGFWDSGNAAPITKNNRISASRAHVCVVAHITRDELTASLQNVELLNGFGNRFLWVLAHREKLVPLPLPMPDEVFQPLQAKLATCVRHAQSVGIMGFSPAARDMWCAGYPALTADKPGLIGAVTDRAEAQTSRMALIYALLDRASTIDTPHLEAALAFWRYCEASARHIFAGRGENPLDEKILTILRSGQQTTTGISSALSRNVRAADIQAALERLITADMVTAERQETSGRPVTVLGLRVHEINEQNEQSS